MNGKTVFGDVELDNLDPRTQRQIKRAIQRDLRTEKRSKERGNNSKSNDRKAKEQQDQKFKIRKLRTPKTEKQTDYRVALFDPSISIITATGIWGTGKTSLATEAAIHQLYDETSPIKKIVIARPAVSGENEIGFEPGDKNEKLAGWCKPVIEELNTFIHPNAVQMMIEDEIIELLNIDQVKGRTFNDTFVIIDEAEDISFNTLKTIIARHGRNSKTVINGDSRQNDRTNHDAYQFSNCPKYMKMHPLDVTADILNNIKGIGSVSFVFDDWNTDCVRSPESQAWGKELEALGLL